MVPDLVLGVERGHPERSVGDLAERLASLVEVTDRQPSPVPVPPSEDFVA